MVDRRMFAGNRSGDINSRSWFPKILRNWTFDKCLLVMRFLPRIFDAKRCHAPSPTTCKLGKKWKPSCMYLGVQYCQIVHYIHFRTLTKQYVATIFSMFFSCGSLHPKSDTIGKQKESQITIETCSTTSWKNSSVNLNHCSNHFRIHSSQRFQSSPLWLREDSLWEVEVSLESQRPRPQRPRPHPQNHPNITSKFMEFHNHSRHVIPDACTKPSCPGEKSFRKHQNPWGKTMPGTHENLSTPWDTATSWSKSKVPPMAYDNVLIFTNTSSKWNRSRQDFAGPQITCADQKDHLRRKSYISQYLLTYWLKMKIGVPWKLMVGR